MMGKHLHITLKAKDSISECVVHYKYQTMSLYSQVISRRTDLNRDQAMIRTMPEEHTQTLEEVIFSVIKPQCPTDKVKDC